MKDFLLLHESKFKWHDFIGKKISVCLLRIEAKQNRDILVGQSYLEVFTHNAIFIIEYSGFATTKYKSSERESDAIRYISISKSIIFCDSNL